MTDTPDRTIVDGEEVSTGPTNVDPVAAFAQLPITHDSPDASTMTAVAFASGESAQFSRTLPPTVGVAALAAAAVQIVENKTLGHWLFTGALVALTLYGVWLLVTTRQASRLPRAKVIPLFLGIALTCLGGIAYLGVLSPAIAGILAVVFSAGLSESDLEAWLIYLVSAIGYALLTVAALVGLLPVTEGVIRLAKHDTTSLVVLPLLLEAVLYISFHLGRSKRRTTAEAVQRLAIANRRIRQRDALLAEAQADLVQVLEGGRVGRFTGRELGPYQLGEVIGRGGMGEVYSGVRIADEMPAAVKVLHANLVEDATQVARFFREATVSSELDSPHIVRVIDSGRGDDGSPYLAMEQLAGQDLADLLRERKKLAPAEVVTLASEVASALSAAQEAGIVHRDLKPQNLFLSRSDDGRHAWKVLDFGISKVSAAGATLTRGHVIGTPSYMSPEQAQGLPVDHRSDVFALAALAYRALTGRPPFTSPDSSVTVYNVIYVMPTRPTELVDVHPDVDLALALGLAKDRDQRLRSAVIFAAALRDAVRGELDHALRAAAKALLDERPWGQSGRPPRADEGIATATDLEDSTARE